MLFFVENLQEISEKKLWFFCDIPQISINPPSIKDSISLYFLSPLLTFSFFLLSALLNWNYLQERVFFALELSPIALKRFSLENLKTFFIALNSNKT